VIQLTGTKTDAPLAFSSIHLGDSENRVAELLGPPPHKEDLTDIVGVLWSYRPYPFSFEFEDGKVTSMRVHSEEAPISPVSVDKAVGQMTDYVLKQDYPEKIGDTTYRVRALDVQTVDFFGDGQKLVFVSYYPHYLQSPTVVIYQVDPAGKVTRVTEALAPGPLQPISGDYLDSHTLKEAVDMSVDGPASVVVAAALKEHSYIVRYPKFFHVDNRKGPGGYLDMSDHAEYKDETTCENFEFSKVDSILAGKIQGDGKGHYLAALAGGKIYLYNIQAITKEGFLQKTLKVIPLPKGFKAFASDPGEVITYTTQAGQTLALNPGP
jgi:hypothetical protein